MTTTWNMNKSVIEGLNNKTENNLNILNTLNGTRITMQNALDVLKKPIMNSTDSTILPPEVQHETVFYTSIRENIATPFVKSFMHNTELTTIDNDISNNSNVKNNNTADSNITKNKSNVKNNKSKVKNDNTVDSNITKNNSNVKNNNIVSSNTKNDNITEGFDIGVSGNVNLNLGDNKTINDVLIENTQLLKNSQNITNIIYFLFLIPIIYIAWFNWTYLLIPTDISSFIDFVIGKIDNNDLTLIEFKNNIIKDIDETHSKIGNIKTNNWKLYEYIYYLTSELDDVKYKKYENIYGENSYSKLKNGTDNIHEPNYFLQCIKYFVLPICFLDQCIHQFYNIFQIICFDSYTLTSIIFLKFIFVFFLWGALQTNFFSNLTDTTLSTNVNTTIPISIDKNGDLKFNMSNISKNLNNITNKNNLSNSMVSLFNLIIFISFSSYIALDVFNDGANEIKSLTIVGILIFILKWSLFISFILNFNFFIFIFVWLYLIIMTFFGYFFSKSSIKHDFFNDFFKNSYSNILQLDLYKYDLINKLKEIRSNNNNSSITKNINITFYNNVQNNIIWLFKFTEKSPLLWSIITFISFCFTTILIETGQIENITISFFIVNIIILIMIFVVIIFIYFGFNILNNHFQFNQNSNIKSNIFKNAFNDIINKTQVIN